MLLKEDKAIEEADLIILVDGDEINAKPYVGTDTQREVNYCKSLKRESMQVMYC